MDTTTSRDDFLLRVYTKEKFYEPCERSKPRFWDSMKEADDQDPRGKGRFFRVVGALDHSVGTPAEGADWGTAGDLLEAECSVTSSQIESVLEVSSKFLEASKDDGSYTGDAEAEKVAFAGKDLFSFADRLIGCGHGTGRLAIVASNSGPSTTVTVGGDLDTPESIFQLRRNQPIEFVNLDTGGTVQATTRITDRDALTHTITVEDAVTVVAGWGIYQAGTYGSAKPNGLRNLVDDGTFSSTYCNVTRTAASYLNARIQDGNGGMQNYSEELVNDLLNLITEEQENVPTELRCNQGIADEHKRIMTSSREFMVTGSSGVEGSLGVNHDKLSFIYGNQKIPFAIDRNLPARELFALWRPGFRKHTLRAADWFRAKGGPILNVRPADGGGTYSYAFVAAMLLDMTISHKAPSSNGALRNVRDRTSGRDA